MQIVMSPTKTMAFDKVPETLALKTGCPRFDAQANALTRKLQDLDYDALKRLFKTSDALTQKIQYHIRNVDTAQTGPALFVFQGEAFKALCPGRFDSSQLEFANIHLRIFSGLYGVLRPMDGIKPYRLDFNTPLRMGSSGIKQFWKEHILAWFEPAVQDGGVILNLASSEYSSVLTSSPFADRIITLEFRQKENGLLKNRAVRSKQARGLFAGKIIREKITSVAAIKDIRLSDYRYEPSLSSSTEWFFVR